MCTDVRCISLDYSLRTYATLKVFRTLTFVYCSEAQMALLERLQEENTVLIAP